MGAAELARDRAPAGKHQVQQADGPHAFDAGGCQEGNPGLHRHDPRARRDVHRVHAEQSTRQLDQGLVRDAQDARLVGQGFGLTRRLHAHVAAQGPAVLLPAARLLLPAGLHDGDAADLCAQVHGGCEHALLQVRGPTRDEGRSHGGPRRRCHCYGFNFEGARFDTDTFMMADSRHGETYTTMPLIHFQPEANYKNDPSNYMCPVYKTAARRGVLSTTGMSTNFVVAMELNTDKDPDKWVLNGAACLLNLTD